ncbi:MAG: F0F1 ATP synthase subunit B' [Salibaculum sp.]|jgi:F-type H+-transporting ATPase subunit b|uniref:F0F1 ATP synthase subunit B' n=1 Tax=Roseovarius halophilus (ex Wu et al. 2025) TaxID=3376060 RepID=UPI00286FC5F8|nr:F0F1 ATP synthase subunit B' [Salibaculum sp.]MDR9426687.1 F0F1 ATP synthase subunit B' [Salibaculum sp.]MDR9481674.1 F0F1 ATP synthase subunit B' [Salibaculum sp.]
MATETPGQTASTCIGADGSAIGMPQLCFDWWPNQIFWLVLALVAIYFVLSRIALPRIAAVLAERAGTITNDIAAADELKQKATEAEQAYEKALADARAEAQRIAAETKAGIQAELDAEMEKADAEIAARTAESEKAIAEIQASARESVRDVAKDVAKDIVTAMGGTADGRTVTAAVDAKMKG